jgi:hypothetical protein
MITSTEASYTSTDVELLQHRSACRGRQSFSNLQACKPPLVTVCHGDSSHIGLVERVAKKIKKMSGLEVEMRRFRLETVGNDLDLYCRCFLLALHVRFGVCMHVHVVVLETGASPDFCRNPFSTLFMTDLPSSLMFPSGGSYSGLQLLS